MAYIRIKEIFRVFIAHDGYKVYSVIYDLCLYVYRRVTQHTSHGEYNLFSLHTYELGSKHFYSGT